MCADICVHGAISMQLDRDGFITPVIDNSLCINCGLCQKTCPSVNTQRIPINYLKTCEVYEGYASDDTIRKHSSSGGVFGQLAYNLLVRGGCVCGVAFDDNRAHHIMIENTDELSRLQNTKYVPSFAHGIYRKVLFKLKEGKDVLFSGTPCEVAACYSFLYKKKYSGNLLTMEVVCHGCPSYLILDKSMEYNGAVKTISFRNKNNGWGYHSQCMTYESRDGHKFKKSRDVDLFYRKFFGEKKFMTVCYNCAYAHMPRVADITIGDSWATQNKDKEQIYKGLSLIIINTENGQKWIRNEGNIVLNETNWLISIYINRNVYTPFPPMNCVLDRKYNSVYNQEQESFDSYMHRTQLGFIDVPYKDKFGVKNLLRRLEKKVLNFFIRDFNIKNADIFTRNMIILMYKIDRFIAIYPSDRYVDEGFILFLESLFKAKK